MVKYRVTVDRNACIACGVAQSICPEVFVVGEDVGRNRVVDKYSEKTTADISIGVVPEELYECVKNAEDACPVKAITVEKIE